MLKKLSGLDDDKLAYFLERVREISRHDETAALIEVDKLVWEIWEEDVNGYDDEEDEEDESLDEVASAEATPPDPKFFTDLEVAIVEFKGTLTSGKAVKRLQISYLKHLLYLAESQTSVRHAPESWSVRLDALSAEVAMLCTEGINNCTQAELNKYLDTDILSIQTVQSILLHMADSLDRYAEASLEITPEMEEKILKIKTRGAWFRANRKLDAAKVAASGNRHLKAAGLRKEAQTILKQDWEMVFGSPPSDMVLLTFKELEKSDPNLWEVTQHK